MSYCVAFLFYLCAVVVSSISMDKKENKYAICKVKANTKLTGTPEGNITGEMCTIIRTGETGVVTTTVYWHLRGFPKNSDQKYCDEKINSTKSCDAIDNYDKNGVCYPNPLATADNGTIETNFEVPTKDINGLIGQSVVIFKRDSMDKPLGEKVACCVYEYIKMCT